LSANAEVPWDDFDPEWYVDHNYGRLRDDDRWILQQVRDFFAVAIDHPLDHGIDVGSGPNLYPSLAMLPFCRGITLLERSRSNVTWLNREIARYSPSWDEFWQLLEQVPAYHEVDPRRALRDRARVETGDLFTLGCGQWDVGTMFFVAESVTARLDEFRRGVHRFIRALKPGAPFAAAFMKNSTGFEVGGHTFPAVRVDEGDIAQCLSDLRCDIQELAAIRSVTPLRSGYDGMILVLGRAGGPPAGVVVHEMGG
jgi:hypothetical protein